ncbi:MAG: RluA family pseudouridine synthase [bacterium]|nr:RluA family pseudouridine synthase [bacterium]
MSDRPAVDPVALTVPPDLDRHRADRIVATLLDLSRSAARKAVDSGQVLLDGTAVAPADKLPEGARLVVSIPTEPTGLVPLELPLEVRYESDTVLVVDKPPGLVVHPGAGHRNDTLANILVANYPELADLGEEHRWGLVHRLDRDTSGLLLVGRTAAAHEELQDQLKRRDVSRVYLALVRRVIDPATGTIEAPIGRDPEHPTRMALRQDGRFARTHYRRLAVWDELSLLEVRLETGRTHQIRVHMTSIDAPIVGDKTYGRRFSTVGDPGRVWLHAQQLTFVDPGGGSSPVTVTSPLPDDLLDSLRRLGDPEIGSLPPGAGGEASI